MAAAAAGGVGPYSSAAVRSGYTRYAIRLQYHGGTFLGFARQALENCVDPTTGTDLRGFVSVETRLVRALNRLLGNDANDYSNRDSDEASNHWNLQVSSRTDRGVHSMGNTFHVDIPNDSNIQAKQLHRGINFHLARDNLYMDHHPTAKSSKVRKRLRGSTLHRNPIGSSWMRYSPNHDVRIISAKKAPENMKILLHSCDYPNRPQEQFIDWNARYSATERTYMYRILYGGSCDSGGDGGGDDDNNNSLDWAAPFEWDRSWRVRGGGQQQQQQLDINAMRRAAQHFIGENMDFSSFRSKGCQRFSPIVNMYNIHIQSQPYGPSLGLGLDDDDANDLIPSLSSSSSYSSSAPPPLQLVNIVYQGNAFLYRQVRNMTGCLVQVGKGLLAPTEVRDIMECKDRTQAPAMAPPQGLYLLHVQHGDFDF